MTLQNPNDKAKTSLLEFQENLSDFRQLENGLRLVISPMSHTRSVTVSFYIGAGSRYECNEQAGISHIVEHACFKGSKHWPTAQHISEAIEGVGGVLNAATDRELTVYYAKVPQNHLKLALNIITNIAINPVFDTGELEKERKVILEELAAVEDNPAQLVEIDLDGLLWPRNPLGRDVAGTPETVQSIPHQQIVDYHRRQYTAHNAVISVAGAVEPDAVADSIKDITTEWEQASPGSWVPSIPFDPKNKRIHVRTKKTEQANVMIGIPGVHATHIDRYTIGLLASALGDGMSSRLFLKIREELGLAYDVSAYTSNFQDTGSFSIYLGVDPRNVLPAVRACLDELSHIRTGITHTELTKVREHIKGRMLLGMEDTRSVSSWHGAQTLLLGQSRSIDEVVAELDAITEEDLSRVANSLIQDDRLHLAVVGPFTEEAPFRDILHF